MLSRYHRFIAVGLLLATLLPHYVRAADRPAIARVAQGVLDGKALPDGVSTWKGVPFAGPPVGEGRWRPPTPPASWTGARDATQFADDCPQLSDPPTQDGPERFLPLRTSEDCLYLNIWSPPHALHTLKPVFVWIYGGGFTNGGSSMALYDGDALARRGVVMVTLNYRIGALGYLAHPALSAENTDHISGNYGLMDQIAALRWNRANIAQFGGDPDQVTIGGHSAGGVSVNALLVAPEARGLFARAIVQSAPIAGLTPEQLTLAEAEKFGQQFGADRGAATAEALRALPIGKLLRLSAAEQAKILPFHPNADAKVLPAKTTLTFMAGGEAPVPMLIGSATGEFAHFIPADQTPAAFERWAATRFGDRALQADSLYPHADSTAVKASMIYAGTGSITSGTWIEASLQQHLTPKVYLYRYDRAPPGRSAERFDAYHGSELIYLFAALDKSDRPWTAGDYDLSERIQSYWVNFVKTGDPNGAGLPVWTPLGQGDQFRLELGLKTRAVLIEDLAHLELNRPPALQGAR